MDLSCSPLAAEAVVLGSGGLPAAAVVVGLVSTAQGATSLEAVTSGEGAAASVAVGVSPAGAVRAAVSSTVSVAAPEIADLVAASAADVGAVAAAGGGVGLEGSLDAIALSGRGLDLARIPNGTLAAALEVLDLSGGLSAAVVVSLGEVKLVATASAAELVVGGVLPPVLAGARMNSLGLDLNGGDGEHEGADHFRCHSDIVL